MLLHAFQYEYISNNCRCIFLYISVLILFTYGVGNKKKINNSFSHPHSLRSYSSRQLELAMYSCNLKSICHYSAFFLYFFPENTIYEVSNSSAVYALHWSTFNEKKNKFLLHFARTLSVNLRSLIKLLNSIELQRFWAESLLAQLQIITSNSNANSSDNERNVLHSTGIKS